VGSRTMVTGGLVYAVLMAASYFRNH